MTESEAKTKWCPMVRVVETPGTPAAGNRLLSAGDPGTRCIGSACMMWRDGTRLDAGYCGLAGKP